MRESKKEEDAPVLDDDALNDLIARRWLLFLISSFYSEYFTCAHISIYNSLCIHGFNYHDSLVPLLVHCDKSSISIKITANSLYKYLYFLNVNNYLLSYLYIYFSICIASNVFFFHVLCVNW